MSHATSSIEKFPSSLRKGETGVMEGRCRKQFLGKLWKTNEKPLTTNQGNNIIENNDHDDDDDDDDDDESVGEANNNNNK